MYLIAGFCVALFSISGLNGLGALVDRNLDSDERKSIWIYSFIASIVYGGILSFCYWYFAFGFYGPSLFAGSIIIGAIIAFIITAIFTDNFEKVTLPSFFVGVLYFLYVLIVLIGQDSNIFNSEAKAKLIGEVEVISDLGALMEPTDPKSICQMSEKMALVKANNALSKFKVDGNVVPGSRYEIVGATKQFSDGQFWWIMELGFQSYFKWDQDKQVPGYLRISAQNPLDESQPVQVNKKGEAISIKYSLSACFDNQAERYLRNNGYLNEILEDWTFEVDEDWNPYLTVSVTNRVMGYSGKNLKKMVVLDMQNGKIEEYSLMTLPAWIDRGMPLDLIEYQVSLWGQYANAGWWYNMFHDDMSQKATPGWYLTAAKDGSSQWFSGFTSNNSGDQALTGAILVDARTGKAKFVKVSGVTEDIAMSTATSLWKNFEYKAEEPVPYNLYGTMTYVIPMSFENQFKGISLVCMSNVDIHAKGNNLEEAISNYRIANTQAKKTGFAPTSGPVSTKTITGIIKLVGKPITQADQQIFSFTLKDVNKIFQVNYSFANSEAPFMNVGDQVIISFQETGEPIITCTTFDLPNLVTSTESIDQKLFLEQRAVTEQEVSRIDQEIQKNDLLNSDRLKNVDPQKLKEFIDSQSK